MEASETNPEFGLLGSVGINPLNLDPTSAASAVYSASSSSISPFAAGPTADLGNDRVLAAVAPSPGPSGKPGSSSIAIVSLHHHHHQHHPHGLNQTLSNATMMTKFKKRLSHKTIDELIAGPASATE